MPLLAATRDMKPVILILIQFTLIASTIYRHYGVASNETITLHDVPNFDAKLRRAVQRYNEAIGAQREATSEIANFAERLRRTFVDELSKLNQVNEPDIESAQHCLSERLKKLLEELVVHYTNVHRAAVNVSTIHHQQLAIQFVRKWYEEAGSLKTDLLYLTYAELIPGVVKMRQNDKRLTGALNHFNFVCDVITSEERSRMTYDISALATTLIQQCDAGAEAVKSQMRTVYDVKCVQPFQGLLRRFAQLRAHYQKICNAFSWSANGGRAWPPLPVDGAEEPKTIVSIYNKMTRDVVDCNVTF